MVAAAAQWPPRPRRPPHTSPTPPPAVLQRPAGPWWPRPQVGHSITSRSSRPCGLQHPLHRRQTGHPWRPNRLPQNQGPTLPWRLRDKGGPSPLPEARTPWGGGEDISVGPFTLLCLHPHSLEPWRGETGPSCQHTGGLRVHRSAGAAPACMGLVQSSGCWWTELQSPSSLPQRTHPTPGGCGDPAGSCLGAPGAGRSRSPPLGMQSLLRMCACSCVCVFIRVSLFKKQPSLWGSWILHVRVNPPVPCPPPLSPRPSLPPPLSSPPQQPALLFPAEKRIVGNSRTLPTHPPAPACWGCLHASPRAPGYPIPISFPPFNKGEERVPNHHQALWSCLVS